MKRKKMLCALLGVLACLYLLWANQAPEVTEYVIDSPNIPEACHGFRIAQISDLHNATFGENNRKLLNLLDRAKPDIIVITGDMIDSRRTDIPTALDFAVRASAIAPCYYVPGNHEARLTPDTQAGFYAGLEEAGVTLLLGQTLSLGGGLTLTGKDIRSAVPTLPPEEGFHILLSHYPELLETYAAAGYDLVFTGHAHGGQIRLPFLGGIFVPGQGFFPKYDAGHFTEKTTQMLISRGLGNSLFPLRINNRPEILLAELHRGGLP